MRAELVTQLSRFRGSECFLLVPFTTVPCDKQALTWSLCDRRTWDHQPWKAGGKDWRDSRSEARMANTDLRDGEPLCCPGDLKSLVWDVSIVFAQQHSPRWLWWLHHMSKSHGHCHDLPGQRKVSTAYQNPEKSSKLGVSNARCELPTVLGSPQSWETMMPGHVQGAALLTEQEANLHGSDGSRQ